MISYAQPTRKIVAVAVKVGGTISSLPPPNRHHNILHTLPPRDNVPFYEGFLDDQGAFLDRRSAFQLASANGQLNRRPGPQFYQGPELFSEDLW